MENAPVISMAFINIAPGASDELKERYLNWRHKVYAPLTLKAKGVLSHEIYQSVRRSLEYPQIGSISHFENIGIWQNYLKGQEWLAVQGDAPAWEKRGVREGVWATSYQLVRGFRSETAIPGNIPGLTIDNANIVHLEAYRLSPEEREKYLSWLSDFAYGFIPLFTKLPGFKGYDVFQNTGMPPFFKARESEYPHFLSIMYFDDLASHINYMNSQEFVIFQKALRSVFPDGLSYTWDVEYQLIETLKK